MCFSLVLFTLARIHSPRTLIKSYHYSPAIDNKTMQVFFSWWGKNWKTVENWESLQNNQSKTLLVYLRYWMLIVSVFYWMNARPQIHKSCMKCSENLVQQKIKLRATAYFSQNFKSVSHQQKGQVTLSKSILYDMKTYFYFLYYSTWTHFSTSFKISSQWRNFDILQAP
jgi:hypothetical protein